MKKLVLLAVATVALFTQAASVSWSSGSYGLMSSDNTQKLGAYAGTGEIVLVLLQSDLETFSDAKVLQKGTISTANKSFGRVYNTYEFTYASGAANGELLDGDVLAVLYKDGDDFKKLWAAGTENDMYTTLTISGVTNNTWSKSFAYATSNFTEPVPEPTSGLLLIVGGALLALRRKQK